MSDTEDDWDEPEPDYHNEVPACRHGMPKGSGCEWCSEEREGME